MKTFLINAAAGCLTLFICVSVQGVLLNDYTPLDVPGASDTYATGIDGINIVGIFIDGSGTHGFSYDGSNYTTLDVPGASNTYALDIDDSNIVGWHLDGNYHGFIYDGSSYTTLDVPGANYTVPYGIDGGNIVGWYSDGSGDHGFLAVIPEPATLSLLALGMLMACRRRRR